MRVLPNLAYLQTKWVDEQFHWVIQEAHGGMAERQCGTMEQIIARVRQKFGVIIGIEDVPNSSSLRWKLTVRDRRDNYRRACITALSKRELDMQPLPPKMPQEVEPMTGPER